MKWLKVIDNARCIGCQACSVACKAEHEVPIGVYRTYVKQVEVGVFPEVQRFFQVTRCNQCEEPPCVESCPVSAMFQRPDGIVDFDRSICIGCKACIAACPYDAIYINPNNHSAEKCNFCAHRIDQGLQPACVAVCPTQAIVVGDGENPESPVSRYLAERTLQVRRPEKGTRPKLYYHQASPATLLPMAAMQLGTNMLAESAHLPAGNAAAAASPQRMASALVGYDVPHRAPWDWKVSAYTWTKSLATGSFLALAVGEAALGRLNGAWKWTLLGSSLLFLAVTGGLLVGHLSHPDRFWLILVRPQWRSWLARGAYIMTTFGALCLVTCGALLAGANDLLQVLLPVTSLFALGTAVFTAFILGQSKGRDLWQNRVLPLHLLIQACLAGAAAAGFLTLLLASPADLVTPIGIILGGLLAVHLALAAYEAVAPHPTAEGKAAAVALVQGHWARWYWTALLGCGLGPLALLVLAPVTLPLAAALALTGLFLYEHAYLQAGQSTPLS